MQHVCRQSQLLSGCTLHNKWTDFRVSPCMALTDCLIAWLPDRFTATDTYSSCHVLHYVNWRTKFIKAFFTLRKPDGFTAHAQVWLLSRTNGKHSRRGVSHRTHQHAASLHRTLHIAGSSSCTLSRSRMSRMRAIRVTSHKFKFGTDVCFKLWPSNPFRNNFCVSNTVFSVA